LIQVKENESSSSTRRYEFSTLKTGEVEEVDDEYFELLGRVVHSTYSIDRSRLMQRFVNLYDKVVAKALQETPLAVPLALAEPLKTRVISKGPPLHYFAMRPLQKKLWSVLKRHDIFQLIGTPVNESIVQSQMGAKLGVLLKYLSVDYSDATNQIERFVSETIVDELSVILDLSVDERKLFMESMVDHIMAFSAREEGRKQQSGQLMGSVVSFPVLCIANAVICRWVLEIEANRPIPFKDCRLLINGDDAVFPCRKESVDVWEKIGSFCGLKPSWGKVYFSSKRLNINSTTYNYHPDGWEGTRKRDPKDYEKWIIRLKHFEETRYVNLGLLNGISRTGDTRQAEVLEKEDWTLGKCATDLCLKCPSLMRYGLLKTFIHKHKEKLQKYSRPWFLPERFGGIGLPEVAGVGSKDHFFARKFDLQVARKIYEHPDVFRMPVLRETLPLRVYQYGQHRLKELSPPGTSLMNQREPLGQGSMISKKTLVSWLVVESLFTRPLEDLFSPEDDTDYSIRVTESSNLTRKMSNVWKKACHDTTLPLRGPLHPSSLPPPLDIDDLPMFLISHPHAHHRLPPVEDE